MFYILVDIYILLFLLALRWSSLTIVVGLTSDHNIQSNENIK